MAHLNREFTSTVFILEGEQVLLHFHAKHSRWMPPGGHLEKNELPSEGALREVEEETGLKVELVTDEHLEIDQSNARSFPRPYLCLLEHLPDHQHIDFVYVASPISGTLSSDMQWFSEKEVAELCNRTQILPDVQEIIHHLIAQRRAGKL